MGPVAREDLPVLRKVLQSFAFGYPVCGSYGMGDTSAGAPMLSLTRRGIILQSPKNMLTDM